MCIRIYIFGFKQKKAHKQNQKAKEIRKYRKAKETKRRKKKENVAVVNNICGKSNRIQLYYIVCVLLTYLIIQQKESVLDKKQ